MWLPLQARAAYEENELRRRRLLAVPAPVIPAFLPTAATSPQAAYGVTRLIAAYAGPCCRVVRASDSATQDIDFVNGYLDIASAVTFMGVSTLTVDIWYDQTGNGNHATQTVAAKRPSLRTANAWQGLQGITFNSIISGGSTPIYFDIPAGVTMDRQNHSAFWVTAPNPSFNTNAHVEFGTTTVTRLLWYTNPGAGLLLNYGSSSAPGNITTTRYPRGNPSVNGFRVDATNAKVYIDDTTYTGTKASAGTATGGKIGSSANSSFDFRGEYFALVTYPAALSDADVASVQTAMKSAYGAVTTQTRLLVFEGDSITEGTGSTFLENNPHLTFKALSVDTHFYNMAVHGTTAATEFARRVAKNTSSTWAVAKRVFVFGLGSNDIAVGTSASTIWTTYTLPYIQYRQGLGDICIAGVLIPRTALTGPQETERLAYNQLLRDNAVANSFTVADYCALPEFDAQADAANLTYYSADGTHPITAGYVKMASVLAPLVSAAIA